MKRGLRAALALVGAAALSIGLAACGSSNNSTTGATQAGGGAGGGTGTGGAVSVRLGYVTTPQHPYGIAIAAFKAAVEKASNGSITVNPIPGASQGNDTTLLNDVSNGTVEAAAVSTAVWDSAGVQVFEPLQAPFLITNYGLAKTVLGGSIGQGMLADPQGPAKLNLVGLGLLEGGLRKPASVGAPLTSPASFQGKKLRAPNSEVMTSGLKDLGATPVAMPLPQVTPSLKNGSIDGLEANYGLIQTQKWYEDLKNVTANVNLWPFPAAVVFNKDAWNKLSADQQQILTTAGKNLANSEIDTVFLNPPASAPNFLQQLCQEGMKVALASQSDLQALTAKVQPTYQKLANNSVTSSYFKQIQDAKAAQTPPPAPPLPSDCKTTS